VTLAAKLQSEGRKIAGLFIDRGQSNLERELEAATYFATKFKINLSMTSLRDWSTSWKKPDGITDKEIPRNAMFVLAALPFARQQKADEIALGSNQDDTAVPDGSLAFVKAMNGLFEAARQPERLIAPFLTEAMGKNAVATLAVKLLGEDDIARTWSCWSGKPHPCGQCSACRTRQKALEKAREQ